MAELALRWSRLCLSITLKPRNDIDATTMGKPRLASVLERRFTFQGGRVSRGQMKRMSRWGCIALAVTAVIALVVARLLLTALDY